MKDLESLIQISYATFNETYRVQNNNAHMDAHLRSAFTAGKMQAELQNPSSFFYFIYQEDNLAGYLKLNMNDAQSEAMGDDCLEIERIYILKSFQKQGFGGPHNRAENIFRQLEIIDSQGKHLKLVTNRFDLDADELSEMYRSRLAIELFFKWIKQHLRVKQFYGQSEQAIHNQIFIALIAFCLNVLAQQTYQTKRKILQISRYLKATLWQSAHTWIRRMKGRASP